MPKKINYIKSVFLLLVLSITSLSNMHSQVPNRTKMQDASISSPNSVPHTGAVLELESNNRGMLVPRMTTAQRDAMPIENRSESLFIYNITTGCFNYWSEAQATWLSLCGTPPPAVFHISSSLCDDPTDYTKIVIGNYKQGDALLSSNFLSIPVTVTQPGTYSVVATSNNGYYFTNNGTFPSAGNYTIQLQGIGTPINGYNSGDLGDELSINLNGVISDCKPNVFVEKANVSYSIDCVLTSNTGVKGDYYVGISATTNNKIEVSVTVSSPGYWNMSTLSVNGVYFSGSGTFTSAGVQIVELYATGTPINSGNYTYNISTNSDSPTSCNGINVLVKPVSYTIDCNSAIVNGNYMQGVATSSINTITLPINVTATGQTIITTNTNNGLSFSSGLIALSTLGLQNVILKASGTPINGTNTVLNLDNPSISNTSCSVDIPVVPQPVTYTMTCNSISLSGSFAPDITMTSSNTMTIQVNATYGGAWNITSDTQNGVSFSGSGTLTVGNNTLILTATGTPINTGSFTYTLTSNSALGSTTCTKSITFAYRTMNILGLGTTRYQPATADADEAPRAIIQSASNFGTNGTVKVQSINIVNGANNTGANLKNLINNNNIDIIVAGYNYDPDDQARPVLIDFVLNKKGVLLFAAENHSSDHALLVNGIFGAGANVSLTSSAPALINEYSNPIFDVDDPITNGPFGDVRGPGKYLGSDGADDQWFENLPASAIKIAHQQNDVNRVSMFRHPNLGYLGCAGAGWMDGDPTNPGLTTEPARISTTGQPLPKLFYAGTTVYNSYLYANAIAWAIKYAQENTISTYQIP